MTNFNLIFCSLVFSAAANQNICPLSSSVLTMRARLFRLKRKLKGAGGHMHAFASEYISVKDLLIFFFLLKIVSLLRMRRSSGKTHEAINYNFSH